MKFKTIIIPFLLLLTIPALSQPKELVLGEGVKKIVRPWTLGPEDSGLVIRGAGRGRTIVSGGVELPAFKAAEGRDGVWIIDLRETFPLGADIPQLFVNGVRAVPARTPDEGSFFIPTACKETVIDEVTGKTAVRKGLAIQAVTIPEDAAAALKPFAAADYPDVSVSFFHFWNITRKPMLSYDPESSRIFVSVPKMKPWNPLVRRECTQFFFTDNAAFLDAPGEYFFDRKACVLYYIPREGEQISSARAVVPGTELLLKIAGSTGEKVRDITFEGITFECSSFQSGWRGEDPTQASYQTGAAIEIDHASGIRFIDCEIARTGANAIWFREDCSDCSITRSYLHDLGVGAVKIGPVAMPRSEEETAKRIIVDNNIIRAGGRELPTGEGVTLFQACDCEITHNDISDFYYSGMSIGWRWGYGPSPSKRNHILWNHIHHIGWGYLSDMGGIYTLGPSEGTEVSFNHIHDIYSFGYGGWGLYTDEGSTGIRMEGNLVHNCKSSAFFQHYGKENHITNNLFINQSRSQFSAGRIEKHLSLTFDRNIIVYDSGLLFDKKWDQVNIKSDNNIYWNTSGAVSFGGKNLEEWKSASGRDSHSIIADPRIGNFPGGIPTISNRKLLRKIGFTVPDWAQCGVYGDSGWKALADPDPARVALFDETVSRYEKK